MSKTNKKELILGSEFKKVLAELYLEFKTKLNLKSNPKLIFKEDIDNANDISGKTGYYDPDNKTIVLYIMNRHPKDILRSLCHELIHFFQDETGKLDTSGHSGEGYSLTDKKLRQSEKQAYLLGNMMMRDFFDRKKMGKQYDK